MTVDVMTPTGEKVSDSNMYSKSSSLFHDYTVTPQQKMIGQSPQPILNGLGPGPGPVTPTYRDHSLQTDLPQTQSPGGVSMYEQDQEQQCGLVSPASDKNFSWTASSIPVEQMLDYKPSIRQLDSGTIGLFDLGMDNNLTLEDSWLENTRGDPLYSPPVDKSFKVEDVFQCDQNQGPTLAQLNSPAEITAMFDCIEKKSLLSPTTPLPASNSGTLPQWQTLQNPQSQYMVSQASPFTSRAAMLCSNKPSHTNTTPQNNYVLSFPIIPNIPTMVQVPPKQAAIPAPATSVAPSRGPTVTLERAEGSQDSLDRKWDDIKEFMQSEESKNIQESEESTSKRDCAFEPNEDMESYDEGFASDSDDSVMDDGKVFADFSSDGESSDSISHLMPDTTSGRKKKKRFFWQYNTQSKGPKGKRLCSTLEQHDPHILDDFTDPVFDPTQSNMRYKHSGKARRGEGNDVNPNPKRLFQIGNELNRLNREIHDMTPVSEQPSTVKPKSRREKNKLASRACRLKKKAQHEANKVKLHGLEREHHQLMELLGRAKYMLKERVRDPKKFTGTTMSTQMKAMENKYWTFRVSGKTSEFVNSVIEKVKSGDSSGGLKRSK